MSFHKLETGLNERLGAYRRNVLYAQAVATGRIPIATGVAAVALHACLWYTLVLYTGSLVGLVGRLLVAVVTIDFAVLRLCRFLGFDPIAWAGNNFVYDDNDNALASVEDISLWIVARLEYAYLCLRMLATLRQHAPGKFVILITAVTGVMGVFARALGDACIIYLVATTLSLMPIIILHGYHTFVYSQINAIVSRLSAMLGDFANTSDNENIDLSFLDKSTPSSSDNKDNDDFHEDELSPLDETMISGINTPSSKLVMAQQEERHKDDDIVTPTRHQQSIRSSSSDKDDASVSRNMRDRGYSWVGDETSDEPPSVTDDIKKDAADNDKNDGSDYDEFQIVNTSDVPSNVQEEESVDGGAEDEDNDTSKQDTNENVDAPIASDTSNES